jgi:hypothetical protein
MVAPFCLPDCAVEPPCVPYLPPFLSELQEIAQDQNTALGLLQSERRRQRYYHFCAETGADPRGGSGGGGVPPGFFGEEEEQAAAEAEDDAMVDLEHSRREAPLLAQLAAFRAVPYNIQAVGSLTAQLGSMDGPALEIWSDQELRLAHQQDYR